MQEDLRNFFEDDNEPKEIRIKKKAVAYPFRRIFESLGVETVISAMFYGVVASGILGDLNEKTAYFYFAVAGIFLYLIVQWFLIRIYCYNVFTPKRRLLTNGLASGVMTVFACITSIFTPYGLHTFLFMPFKLFYLLDIMNKTMSAVCVGVLLTAITCCYMLFYPSKRLPFID